jgi:hypothetical protein
MNNYHEFESGHSGMTCGFTASAAPIHQVDPLPYGLTIESWQTIIDSQ